MKKYFLFAACMSVLFTSFSQNDRYMKAMQDKVAALDTTRTSENSQVLSAAFERIADAEKDKWLPYYYAALTQVNVGYFMNTDVMAGGMAATFDPIADKAESLLNKAEALSENNSEIYVVKKMIASLRMIADPMSRYMQYAPIAQEALATAKKLNPENPRVYLLEAQDKFYTPEQYGGSKSDALELFQTSLKKYDSFQPASSIDPHWGKATAAYFLGQLK